jgi:hypothetical protein
MKNTDMNAVEFLNATNYNLYDLWSTTSPQPDTTLGGRNDLQAISYTSDGSGYATIIYTRFYNTNDDKDYIVIPNEVTPVSFAWNDGTFGNHGYNILKSSVFIDTGNGSSNNSSTFDFWQFHGIIMTVSWSFMNFIGYLTVRFFKHNSIWMWFHFIFAGLNASVTIGVLSASIKYSKKKFFLNFKF